LARLICWRELRCLQEFDEKLPNATEFGLNAYSFTWTTNVQARFLWRYESLEQARPAALTSLRESRLCHLAQPVLVGFQRCCVLSAHIIAPAHASSRQLQAQRRSAQCCLDAITSHAAASASESVAVQVESGSRRPTSANQLQVTFIKLYAHFAPLDDRFARRLLLPLFRPQLLVLDLSCCDLGRRRESRHLQAMLPELPNLQVRCCCDLGRRRDARHLQAMPPKLPTPQVC
jgi:hypothetical protein